MIVLVLLLCATLAAFPPGIDGSLAGYAVYYTDSNCETTPVLVTPRTTTTMTLNTADGSSCAGNVVCAVNTADPSCTSLSGTQQVATQFSGGQAILTINGVDSPRGIGACVASVTYSGCYLRMIQPPPTECLNQSSDAISLCVTGFALLLSFALALSF